ncbi:MAG: molybdenum cofactor biosynthesis protein [Rickettsiaceae bacterium]|jgi:molybdenum cofactor synthesis domain-containing protein|nr:molybdenum cofactor biosynthesis protein [Rickettsiaceae bacterium]
MVDTAPKAALIVIGNEILSGRTEDKNINYIAKELGKIGIRFAEVRVIPDITKIIVDTVNEMRSKFDYVFTTGGIGPTHDDITTESVAKAFGVPVVSHPEALGLLEEYYKDRGGLNEGRRKMTLLPQGADLIDNPISTAPGFVLGNVYVMAGIPNIMQAMMDSVKSKLKGGALMISRELKVYLTESTIATPLRELQERNPDLDIGSYPFVDGVRFGTSLVLRGTNEGLVNKAYEELEVIVKAV